MSNPLPAITFEVDLSLLLSEARGPLTNSTSDSILHPDQFQHSPDHGREETNNRSHTRSTWIPGAIVGSNRVLKHGDQFILYGQQAIYIRKMYCSSVYGGEATPDRAILKVI